LQSGLGITGRLKQTVAEIVPCFFCVCRTRNKMKILISDMCGFFDSHLALYFVESHEGITIVGLDNLARAGSEMMIGLEGRQSAYKIENMPLALNCRTDLQLKKEEQQQGPCLCPGRKLMLSFLTQAAWEDTNASDHSK
jgi:hypothetical protein